MGRAVQMEIFRNKRTILGGTLLFPFQPVETEITVPLAQNSFSTARESARAYTNFLRQHDLPKKIASFLTAWKKPFLLTPKIFRNFTRKILAKWKAPHVSLAFRNQDGIPSNSAMDRDNNMDSHGTVTKEPAALPTVFAALQACHLYSPR